MDLIDIHKVYVALKNYTEAVVQIKVKAHIDKYMPLSV